ncbi:MAG: cupin domain-containing protein [Methanospirillum sp.]|nr:cupin domain-containing protein [Methanospirillum sp.]
MNLLDAARFSREGPVKTEIAQTAGSNIALVCLEQGQVIPPHPEPYAVAFVVLEGEGVITSGLKEHTVTPLHLVPVGEDEDRGIRCTQRMILLGIRDDV